METVRRFGGSLLRVDVERLAELGVTVKIVAGTGMGTFEVGETNPRWQAILEWATGRGLVHSVGTRFSDEDLEMARWLLMSTGHRGYPPEDFASKTFRLSCGACGWRDEQVAPFRVDSQIRRRGGGIVQLNWVFDELFVGEDIYRAVFEPIGIGQRVVCDGRGRELASVVQLVIQESVDVVPATVGSSCGECGRGRHLPHTRGRFPKPTLSPTGDLVRTNQRFGSGRSTHREVILSQRLRRAIVAARPRDAAFVPVEE